MVLFGFVLALWYAMAAARRRMAETAENGRSTPAPNAERPTPNPITPDHVFDMSLAGLFVGIVGARILYVLLDPQEFRSNWWDVLKVWTGGISIHGAIVSSAIFLWWYCRRHKLNYLEFADLCAPAFALGYAIGRIGCFLNGCCYGAKCSLPWATKFIMDEHSYQLTPPSHPTQLYATVMNLISFAILDRWSRKSHRRGEIFLGFIAFYSIYRFIDEYFRKGATATVFFWGLTHAQVFSLIVLPIAIALLLRIRAGKSRIDLPEAAEPTASLPQ